MGLEIEMRAHDLSGFGQVGTNGPASDLLTKRDLFAVHAMQAFIGTSAAPALFGLDDAEPHIARAAYRMADAMLAAGGAA